ncbi:hypothetical protein NEQG_00903, partial [Nematocida parisii ERTm3]
MSSLQEKQLEIYLQEYNKVYFICFFDSFNNKNCSFIVVICLSYLNFYSCSSLYFAIFYFFVFNLFPLLSDLIGKNTQLV